MARKIMRVKLAMNLMPVAPGKASRQWTVIETDETIDFHPGQKLDEAEVKHLCRSDRWKVKIVAGKKAEQQQETQ